MRATTGPSPSSSCANARMVEELIRQLAHFKVEGTVVELLCKDGQPLEQIGLKAVKDKTSSTRSSTIAKGGPRRTPARRVISDGRTSCWNDACTLLLCRRRRRSTATATSIGERLRWNRRGNMVACFCFQKIGAVWVELNFVGGPSSRMNIWNLPQVRLGAKAVPFLELQEGCSRG